MLVIQMVILIKSLPHWGHCTTLQAFTVIHDEEHHNTEDSNAVYRQYNRYYYNNNFYYKGMLLTEEVRNGGDSLYMVTMNRYSHHTLTNRENAQYTTLDTTVICYYEGTGSADIRQVKTFRYETTYGNVTQQTETSTDMPVITANITYHADPGNYRVGIPSSVEIPGYRRRTTTVDNKGQMTQLRDYYDNSSYLATIMSYDSYGNVTRMVYPNHSYSYAYDNEVHSYAIPSAVLHTCRITTTASAYR